MSAQAHGARAGQQKFSPDVFTELQSTARGGGAGWDAHAKGRNDGIPSQTRRGRAFPHTSAWMCQDLERKEIRSPQFVNNKQLVSVCVCVLLCPCVGLFVCVCVTVPSGHNCSNDLLNVK